MKKFLKRKAKDSSGEEAGGVTRITNETVAEHREQVLAGGRKFKYPLQYQRHKLVINTIVIGSITVALLVALGWYQLYVAQNSSKIMYRVTQIIPVTVASVDGESVRYSDYLMRYRSSIYFAEKQENLNLATADGQRQASYIQRQELNKAEDDAYVNKLARDKQISVSDKEVDAFIQKDIDTHSVSLNAYEKTVLNTYYDWSLDEYKSIVRAELLKRKVAFAVDPVAKDRAEALLTAVKGGADFSLTAKASSDDPVTSANGGDSGDVSLNNLDANGLTAEAKKLSPGQLSAVFQGVDGYYFIKLTAKNDSSIRYQFVEVKLTALEKQLEALRKQGKIKEFISVAQQ